MTRFGSIRGLAFDAAAGALVTGPVYLTDSRYGLAAAGGLVLARALGGRLAMFAVAQLVIGVFVDRFPSFRWLATSQAGALLVLFVPPAGDDGRIRYVGATILGVLVVGGVSLLGYRETELLWVGGTLVVITTALVGYGLHRYELLTRGVLTDE